MKTEFLKELYFEELRRKEQETSAPTIAVAVLTLVCGIFSYYLEHFRFQQHAISYLFIVSLTLAVISFAFSICFIIRSYVGYTYQRLPCASTMKNYYEKLLEYNRATRIPDEKTEQEFDDFLRQRMAEATKINSWNNNSRAEFIYKAIRYLAFLVVFTFVAGIPIIITVITDKDKTQPVYITNLNNAFHSGMREHIMCEQNQSPENSGEQSSSPASVEQQSQPRLVKPVPPSNQSTKAGTQPPNKPK